MKRAMFSVLTLIVLAGLTGCATQHGRHPLLDRGCGCVQPTEGCEAVEGCQSCEDPCDDGCVPARAHCGLCKGRGCRACRGEEVAAPGPPTGAITYPYYTVRGPRDYLARNPQSIGP
jgi:hypothetical protein